MTNSNRTRRNDQEKSGTQYCGRDRKCGKCAACLDDARWERIFQAKFADPFYYKCGPVRSSPIQSL